MQESALLEGMGGYAYGFCAEVFLSNCFLVVPVHMLFYILRVLKRLVWNEFYFIFGTLEGEESRTLLYVSS